MAITGRIWLDPDGDGVYDGGETALAGITVRITEVTFFNGYSGHDVTNAAGLYNINDAGIVLGVNYQWQAVLPDTYYNVVYPSNPYQSTTVNAGDVRDGPFFVFSTRVISRWLVKVDYVQNLNGVRVTFKDRHGKLFSCFYPGTTLDDYFLLINAAGKGEWIHWFYDKKRIYIPCAISP